MSLVRLLCCLVAVAWLTGCSDSQTLSPLERGQAAFQNGQWDEAISACSEAIREHEHEAAAYLCRGRAYHCKGELQRAIADFTESIRLNPNECEAYYQRANAYRDGGDAEQYAADERAARKLDPTYSNAFLFAPSQKTTTEELDDLSSTAALKETLDDDPLSLPLPSKERNTAAAAAGSEPAAQARTSAPPSDVDPLSKTEELLGIEIPRSSTLPSRAAEKPLAGKPPRRSGRPRDTRSTYEREALDQPALSDIEDQEREQAIRDAQMRAQGNAPRRPLAGGAANDPRANAGQPYAGQPYAGQQRPLHPYAPSTMRGTGAPTQQYGPYSQIPGDGGYSGAGGYPGGGYSGGVGQRGYPSNPYAPAARGASPYTPAGPNTYIPPVPGLRDDVLP